jgi:hypothetical protein
MLEIERPFSALSAPSKSDDGFETLHFDITVPPLSEANPWSPHESVGRRSSFPAVKRTSSTSTRTTRSTVNSWGAKATQRGRGGTAFGSELAMASSATSASW